MSAPSAKEFSRRPRISREFLEEHRRRRFVEAVAELLHEFARADLSVTTLVRLAGTARNSFYDLFASTDDCIAYGVSVSVEELFAPVQAFDGEGEWVREMEDAITAFYEGVLGRPLLAELFLIHSGASKLEGARVAARAGAEGFVPLLARGRIEAKTAGRELPALADEFFSRAIVDLARRRVREPGLDTLIEEGRRLFALIAGFYLGPPVSDRILGAELTP